MQLFLHFSQTGERGPPRREKCVQFCNTKCLPTEISAAICRKGQIAPMMWEGDFHRLLPPAGAFAHFSGWWEKWAVGDTFLVQKGLLAKSMPPAAIGEKTAGKTAGQRQNGEVIHWSQKEKGRRLAPAPSMQLFYWNGRSFVLPSKARKCIRTPHCPRCGDAAPHPGCC